MPLADLTSLARECAAQRTGLGAFNVVHVEQAEAYADAAERADRPVVLQISQNAVKFHGRLAPMAAAVLAVARSASTPVVVHLDHAVDVALAHEAIRLGFTSVMYDGSTLAYEANVAATADMVSHAHAVGVSVEAELGEVGGKNGAHHPAARTEPHEASSFVEVTGVDLLAVAVGSSHAMTTRDAELDTELVAALAQAVGVPLVLHGSSGVSDEGMRDAIHAGMTKINVATHLSRTLTEKVRKTLRDQPDLADSRKWFGPGVEAAGDEVERLLRWYATV